MHPLNILVLITLAGQAYCGIDLSRLCERRSRSLHYLMSIRLCDRYRAGSKSTPVSTSSRERELEPTATALPEKSDSGKEEDSKENEERANDGYLRFGRSVDDPTEKPSDDKTKEDAKRYMRFGRAYMRFGKKSNDYLRFGQERDVGSDIANDKRYMRFGRGGEEVDDNSLHTEMDDSDGDDKRYMRFGRSNDEEKRYMRFGRAHDDEKRYMRFGRAHDDEKRYMRFGKRYMRFGRSDQDEKRYMRFGRAHDDEKRYMRFGKRSTRSKRSADETKEDSPLERLQRLLHEERAATGGYLRFGRGGDALYNDDASQTGDKRFMRFGRADYLRFGRLSDDDDDKDEVSKRYMRFGRFMRFGKNINSAPSGYMRFSRDNGLMRLSRQLAEREPAAGYLRFGKK